MSDPVKAAIIGALSALVVIVIKDIILDSIRRSRESKKALIDRKLSELYSPLWVALGGGANGLGTILADDVAYTKLTANFHLLSNQLRTKLEAYMALGSGPVRHPQFGSTEMEKALQLQPEVVKLLQAEIKELRSQYEKC